MEKPARRDRLSLDLGSFSALMIVLTASAFLVSPELWAVPVVRPIR